MSYSAGTIFLEIAPSFNGVQKATRRAVREAMTGAQRDARDVQAGMEKDSEASGKRAGRKYGSAFERLVTERMPRMQEAVRSLESDVGRSMTKQLKDIEKLDLARTTNQRKALNQLREMHQNLDGMLNDTDSRMTALTRVNLGALREQMRAISEQAEKWKAPEEDTRAQAAQQRIAARRIRAEREMDREFTRRGEERLSAIQKEQAAQQRLGETQQRASRMMHEDFTRRGQERLNAIQREQSAERERVNLAAQARRMMDADYNARGDAIMKAREAQVNRALRTVQERAGQDRALRIGIDIDEAGAIAQMQRTRAELEAITQRAINMGIDVDESSAVRSARSAVTAAEAAVEAQVLRIRAEVDSREALAEATRLRSQIAILGEDIRFNPNLDTAATRAKIEQLKAALRSISGSVNVAGDIARLEALDRALSRSTTQAVRAGNAWKQFDASGAANSVRVFNGVALATVALGPLLIPVLGVIATGFVGVGVAALGALVGVGALVAGLAGVGGAVKAMSELQKAKRTAPGGTKKVESGRQDISDARALADAQKALTQAREAAAKANEAAAQKVADTELRLADVRERAGEAMLRASENVTSAETRLRDAQSASLATQRALNDARAQAARDLQDINNQLASARLAEEASRFSVEEAQVHLNVVLEDDQATDREKATADLALRQAVQRRKEQLLALSRLETETKQANDAGVEGSDRVVEAKDRITQANDAVGEAEKALAQARKDYTREQVDQNRNIVDAQKDLADAVKGVAEARVESDGRVADAQERISRLLEDQVLRAREAAIATGSLATATNNLDEAMRNLSPAGQEFARFLYSLAPLLKDIRFAAQEGMLPGFQAGLEMLVNTYGPGLVTFIGDISEVFGDLAVQAATALTGPWWQQFFGYMAEVTPIFLQQWGELGGNIVTFFAGISQAFAPLAIDIMDNLVRGSEIIADWATSLKDTQGFRDFIDYMRDAAPEVGALFSNLFTIIGKLFIGLAPYSDMLLEWTIAFTDWLAAMSPNDLAKIAFALGGIVLVVQVIAGSLSFFLGFVGLIKSVVAVVKLAWTLLTGVFAWFARIPAIWIAIQRGAVILGGALAGISAPVWIVIGALTALVGAFVVLWKNNEGFRDAVKDIWGSIVDAWNATLGWIVDEGLPALGRAAMDIYKNWLVPFGEMMGSMLGAVGAAFQLLWDIAYLLVLKPLGEAIGFLWENWVKPIFNLIWQIITEVVAPVFLSLWQNVISPTFGFISAIFTTTWAVMKTIFDAIFQIITFVVAPVFQWLYDKVISPVFGWIGDKISTVWNDTIKPIFDALGSYISETVAPVFAAAVELIGNIWGALLDFLRTPIRLAIEYVVNKGLIGAFNWLAERVPGMTKLDEVAIPAGLQPGGIAPVKNPMVGQSGSLAFGSRGGAYADGGILPGYSPGRDNHRFVSDTGLVLDLAGGEPVLRPEAGAVLGKDWVDGINQAARVGGTGGVSSFLGGYAKGGMLPKMSGGSLEDFFSAIGDVWGDATNAIGKFASSASSFIANPADSLAKVVKQAGAEQGLTGFLGEAGIGIALKPLDAISKWVKGLFGDDVSADGRSRGGTFSDSGANPMGYQAQIAALHAQFPNARVTSSYRPGAVTAVGTKSYHGLGRAIDIEPNRAIAQWLFNTYPNSRELIHTPMGAMQIQGGKPFSNFAPITKSQHYNHIHWAMARGGMVPDFRNGRDAGGAIVPNLFDTGGDVHPGYQLIANQTGKTESLLTDQMMAEVRAGARANREGGGAGWTFTGDLVGYTPEQIAAALETERSNHIAAYGIDEMSAV